MVVSLLMKTKDMEMWEIEITETWKTQYVPSGTRDAFHVVFAVASSCSPETNDTFVFRKAEANTNGKKIRARKEKDPSANCFLNFCKQFDCQKIRHSLVPNALYRAAASCLALANSSFRPQPPQNTIIIGFLYFQARVKQTSENSRTRHNM